MEIDAGRNTYRKCTPHSAEAPVCRGTIAGKCPTQDSSIGPTMCVLKATTKLRDVVCCDASTDVAASDDCLQCFPDPNEKNQTIAGSYACILQSQCRDFSAFMDACDTSLSCDTPKNGGVCSGAGTCAPSDPDDPVHSFGCLCQDGYAGDFCDQVVSDACQIDCGRGSRGQCTDKKCECHEGWTGLQCEKCAADESCNAINDGGTCNLATGICDCNPGFQGNPTCSAHGGDACANIDCGANGQCMSGSCVCLNQCAGSSCQPCAKPKCTDCTASSAPSWAPTFTLLAVLLLGVAVNEI